MAGYSIEKLNASNYSSWSMDMKFVLMERGLWEIVNGAELSPEKAENLDEDLREYKSRCNMAISLIYLNIEKDYRKVIETFEDPVLVWTALEKYFRPDSRSFHMKIFSELVECRIMPGESTSLYAARLSRIYDQIRKIDGTFSEYYISFQFLRYLPSHFDGMVQTLLRLKSEDFLFKNLVQEIAAEEVRLDLRSSDGQALLADKMPIKTRGREFKRTERVPEVFIERSSRSPSRRGGFPNKARNRSQSKRADTRQNERRRRERSPSNRCSNRSERCKSPFSFFISACLSEKGGLSDWVFDTAASHHFCRDRNLFSTFTPLNSEKLTVAVDNVSFPILGKGIILMKFGSRTIKLKEVMYSPNLRRNLMSGPRFDVNGATFLGGRGEVKVQQHNKTIFRARLKNGIYYVFPSLSKHDAKRVTFAAPTSVNDQLCLWHKRLSHISPSIISRTCREKGVVGLPDFKDIKLNCEPCRVNKFKRVSFKPLNEIRSKKPLELLYADIWGPSQTRGKNGELYYLTIIDDYSRKASLYPIREKSDACYLIKRHIEREENLLGRRVKAFRMDNGGEFIGNALENYFIKKGIKHELTNIYTPEQNGVPERYNQTVVSGARTILDESGLHKSFWTEAMIYFTYNWNRVCHSNQIKSPLELYIGHKPSVRHLKPFGCLTYVGVPKPHRSKLDARAQKGYLLGYAFKTRGYRVWLPEKNKVIETKNVSFDENKFYGESSGAVMGTNPYNTTEIIIPSSSRSYNEDIVRETSPVSDDSLLRTTDDKDPEVGLRKGIWLRKPVMRSDKSRRDIYFYEQGNNRRLRSLNDVKTFCLENNILFEPNLFDFSGNNDFEGLVNDDSDSQNPLCSLNESS
ncbi:Retrovirus-related Pol polyprotein from transposon TNT 1-94 [Araneus ventricosus]|uniref:Retrovirus-related Pol polyprotein from transposon TNT 1-94 n=1 Tax=Araneus ventricosus TaxID=182803 RepID=A0A4Y2DBE6_ARAVE|nr:Retrovirus-related Pol polyprotein from transposon TNT 1-94 [Araneus ventricosus]